MGTKIKMSDLNEHLFAELERLSDEELTGEELTAEIERAKAISTISKDIIQTGALVLKATELKMECEAFKEKITMPEMLEG